MGIGRREFLKFVTSALAGSAIAPTAAVFTNSDYYVNQRLGLGFQKPAAWFFEGFRDFSQARNDVIWADERMDQIAKSDLLSDPLVIVSKYPMSGVGPERFSPAVVIYLSTVSAQEGLGTLSQIVNAAVEGYQRVLEQFSVLDAPRSVQISKCEAYRAKARFLFRHQRAAPTLVDMDGLFINHADGRSYTIHMFDSPYVGEDAQPELRHFVESLHLI